MDAEFRAWRVRERARLNKNGRTSSIDRLFLTSRNRDAVFERQSGRTLGLYWINIQDGWKLALPIVVQEDRSAIQ